MASYHWMVARNWVPVRLYVPPECYAQLALAAKDYERRGSDMTAEDNINDVINIALAYWLKHRATIEAQAKADYNERAAQANGTAGGAQ